MADVTLRCCVRRYRNVGSCSPNDKAPRHQAPVLSCTRQSEQNGDISAGALILNITFRSTMRTVRYVYRPVKCQALCVLWRHLSPSIAFRHTETMQFIHSQIYDPPKQAEVYLYLTVT